MCDEKNLPAGWKMAAVEAPANLLNYLLKNGKSYDKAVVKAN